MKKYTRWIIAIVTLLTLVALAPLVAQASTQAQMVPRSSEVWSRGKIIGQTPVKQRIALQPAPSGGAFLIWLNLEQRLEMVHIGVGGEILLNRALEVVTKEARDPQLVIGFDGRLHLLWREGKHPRTTIRYALLQADGTLVRQPETLSDPTVPVLDAPRLILDAAGQCHAIWADETGIRWTVLSAGGELMKSPTLLAPEGRFPTAQMDDRGHLHLVWRWPKRSRVWLIYYTVLDLWSGIVSQPEELAEVHLRPYHRLGGPDIGLTLDMGYVFWEVRDYGYVYSLGEYASFPLESPQQSVVAPLGPRRGQDEAGMYPLAGVQAPQIVALNKSVPDPEAGELYSQIVVATMGERRIQEDVVTASSRASLKPVLVKDDHSHLHVAWLETSGFGEYSVAYASTASEVIENYNTLTLLDIVDRVFDSVFRLSTLVVSLVGSLIAWACVPFVGLLIYHLTTNEETLATMRARLAIVAALGAEVVLTFMLPPNIGVDVIWSASRWIVPTISAIVTAAVMARFIRRQEETHLFGAFFLFTVVNSVLQIVLFLLFQ